MDSTTAYYWCAVCTDPIIGDDIDARHSDYDGNDVHVACCPVCRSDFDRYEKED